MMKARCPYCRYESELALKYSDGRMTVCESCHAWFVWPPRTHSAITEHYDQNVAGMPAQLRAWRTNTSQNGWYGYLARRIARKSATTAVTSVVDVGAGALELTVMLARAFPLARVEAWDLFAGGFDPQIPPDIAGRVTWHRIDLNQPDVRSLLGKTFDVVACVATIEHVLEPLALLRILRSITAPGGFAYVLAPEVNSIAHRLLRQSWPYYCPDDHLTLPSLSSIESALSLVDGGFYRLRRINVRYSLNYLLRFLHVPMQVPAAADLLLPIPSGAFELIWHKAASDR